VAIVSKTLNRGLSKTRSGSPSISIQSLADAMANKGFGDRIKKAVSDDEALDAAKMLSQKGRVRRYAEHGAIGGLAYPIIGAAGDAAGRVAEHAGSGKLRAAGTAARAALRAPELVKNVTRGVLSGGVVQAAREGVEVGKAKKTVRSFIEERKTASDLMRRLSYLVEG
jgi:hypothetical protein